MGSYADAIGTYEKVGHFYAGQGFSLKVMHSTSKVAR